MSNEISKMTHDGDTWYVMCEADGKYHAHNFKFRTKSFESQEALLAALSSGAAHQTPIGTKVDEAADTVVLKKKKKVFGKSRKEASDQTSDDAQSGDSQAD